MWPLSASSLLCFQGTSNRIKFFQLSLPGFSLRTIIRVPCEQRLHFYCVSYRAKSSVCQQQFNFLLCMREICQSSGQLSNGASFVGIEKIATTPICYARLMQDSKCNKLNQSKTGKNLGFLIYSSRFLDGFERLSPEATFARQFTQRKCSLCCRV